MTSNDIHWLTIKQTVNLQEHKCVKVKKILRCNSETIPSSNEDKHYVLVIQILILSERMNFNPCRCISVTPSSNFFGLVVHKNINLNSWDSSLLLYLTNSYSCLSYNLCRCIMQVYISDSFLQFLWIGCLQKHQFKFMR